MCLPEDYISFKKEFISSRIMYKMFATRLLYVTEFQKLHDS